MDLNKLKKLAEAAYKGEWVAVGESGAIHMGDRFDKYQAMMPNTWTARYVAAAKPTAVLELIAVNEALADALIRLTSVAYVAGDRVASHFGSEQNAEAALIKARSALALQEKMKSGN